MSMGSLIEKFRTVGLERIEQMNSLLVALEREPDDAERVDELMREIHTLKGEAKMMGFADINLVAHQTESLLLSIIDDEVLTDSGPVDLAFEGLDLMRALLTKTTGSAKSALDLTGFVDRINAHTPAVTPPVQSDPASDGDNRDDVEDQPGDGDDAPSDDASESSEDDDSDDEARSESGHSTLTRIAAPDTEKGDDETGSLRIQASSSLRVDVEKLERIGDLAGETILMSRRLDYHLEQLDEIRQDMRGLHDQIDANLPKHRSRQLRDLTHRLDACETSLREESYLVNLRASQVDNQARRLRHLPLAQVLSHYPRAVRDLANAQGKRVRLTHAFGNVEVDRTILTALSEPLLHLVRNAVDHGIESPEEREEQGKEPEGEISLNAEYIGDSIRVELSDDGSGIDPERVRQQATQRDYFSEKKAESLSDQEAIALIFEPGFTTRDDVSDISGRGVGMDVVRRQITRIGGFIEVESEVGQGTCFTLHLPISSAINAVLVFAIGERRFALSAKDVTRVAMVERDQLRTVHGGVCLQTDDGLCPLVDWSSPLGLEERGSPPDPMTVLLVRKGARRLAVWIDEVVGEREAVSRSLGDFLGGASLCRGVALTDSGAVVPMLDVMELAKRSSGDAQLEMERSKRSSYATVQNSRPGHRRTVLVVEDSEVTRSLVVSILKNRGYRVIEADDGHHGWARLQRHNVDLVLTDIQMPRMDGLELLKTIRSSEKYSALPVVILTTLGEAEDKKKAMGLGANGYLVKLSFQEEDLLEAVSRYIG